MNNRSKFWKDSLPKITYVDLIAALLITIAAVFLFSKNMFIDNAVVFRDEYLYKVSADRQLNQALVLERGLTGLPEPMPNKLFLSLYGIGSYFGSNYYIFAQFLNVIFWSLGIFVLFRLAILSGLSHGASIAYLGSVALLPFSAYTKYFMPESMYFFMFCLGVYTLFIGIQKQKSTELFLSGLIIGLAYFVKPHAVFVFIVTVLYFFFIKGQNKLRLIGVFCGGALLAMTFGQIVFLKSSCASAYLCGYGRTPGNLLEKTQFYLVEYWRLLSDLLYVGVGHSLFLFSVFGIAYLLAVVVIFPRLRLLRTDSAISEPLRLISSYTVLLSIVLVLVTALFTVLNGELGRVEIGRIHSRYYFFVFPLLLLIIFHAPAMRLTKTGIIAGLIFCFIAVVSLASVTGNYSKILPVSLVSDGPEMGFAFISKPILYLSAILLLGTCVLVIFNPPKYGALVVTIILLSLLSSANVITKQKGIFRGLYTTGRDAIAVEQMIGKEEMDHVLIVGENPNVVSRFLFSLSSTPNIDFLDSGSNVENSLNKFPESKWLVVISGGYYFSERLDCSLIGTAVTICSVSR